MNRILKPLLCTLAGIPLVMILLVPLIGPMWHLFYGDFVTYHQWKIRVPSDFYVRQYPDGPFLWKYTIGFPFWRSRYAMIGVTDLPHPFEYEEDYQNFTTGADLAAQDQGYKFLSTQKVSIGKSMGFCHEYGLSRDPTKSFAQCAIEHTDLLLGYRGHTKYIPILLSTLQSISDQDTQSLPGR